jgi:thiol-disulfide isomerase/thioredoxin
MKKTLIPFFLGTLIFLTFFSGCTEKKTPAGDDFIFTTIDGQTRHLRDYVGNVLLLDCMAVNCYWCDQQMPELERVSQEYGGSVTILSIDVWTAGPNAETAGQLEAHLQDLRVNNNLSLNWTFGLDDSKGTIQGLYAPDGIPMLYLFDKNGNIYYSHVGYEEYSSISEKLNEVLAKGL